jgi:hypothetical protein
MFPSRMSFHPDLGVIVSPATARFSFFMWVGAHLRTPSTLHAACLCLPTLHPSGLF